ncbi:MAG: Glycosyl transferase family 2 [Candidatus Curtissbacteria bacterium GW2011_GWA1_40_16]|uniref:Glycosyl transferase family 2 n=1 Tax=Candidatus Curtissbacteria bacterium GW2011_GWA1_40_16 TaxID=1618405 RepID=A0A0G0TT53_9BACT|nr:MAG: Glycosyl transferase family 2 [Candidatus Curtissbacteria bacterium GW2011_GWA1_40_16]
MIYFLIPSYEDAPNIKNLAINISKSVKPNKYKIVIIDDGSTDETIKVIDKLSKKFPINRIGYYQNKGPGYAFNIGFRSVIPRLKEEDIVVTMEADSSSDFKKLPSMISKSELFDIVLASPFAKGGRFIGLDINRKILTYTANYLDTLIFRIPNVKTYSSFYRVYSSKILKKALRAYNKNLISDPGFSGVVEFLIKLDKLGAKVCEVPTVLDWRKRIGKSKMKVTKTIINHLTMYQRYFIGRYNI